MNSKQGVIDGATWSIFKPVKSPTLPKSKETSQKTVQKPTPKMKKMTQAKVNQFLSNFNPTKIRFVTPKSPNKRVLDQLSTFYGKEKYPTDGK